MLTTDQLIERQKYITSTDIAALFGCSPWKSNIDVYLEKTEPLELKEMNFSMARGLAMEPFILSWYSKSNRIDSAKIVGDLFVHPDYPACATHIDAVYTNTDGEAIIVEIKDYRSERGWGEEGSDEVPMPIWFQVAYQAVIYEAATKIKVKHVDIAASINGQYKQYRYYRTQEDREEEKKLLSIAQRFYDKHVVPRITPEPIAFQDAIRLFSQAEDSMVLSNDLIDAAVEDYCSLKRNVDYIEERMDRAKDLICSYMKNNSTLTDKFGKVLATWKNRKGAKYFNVEEFKKIHPLTYEQFISVRPPTRTFKIFTEESTTNE